MMNVDNVFPRERFFQAFLEPDGGLCVDKVRIGDAGDVDLGLGSGNTGQARLP
jgi:hypothetical protein